MAILLLTYVNLTTGVLWSASKSTQRDKTDADRFVGLANTV